MGKACQTTGKEHAFLHKAENNGVEMIITELFIPAGFTLHECYIIIQKNIYLGERTVTKTIIQIISLSWKHLNYIEKCEYLTKRLKQICFKIS